MVLQFATWHKLQEPMFCCDTVLVPSHEVIGHRNGEVKDTSQIFVVLHSVDESDDPSRKDHVEREFCRQEKGKMENRVLRLSVRRMKTRYWFLPG